MAPAAAGTPGCGQARAVLRAAGGAVCARGPGRERSSCLKGRRGTWLGRSSRPPGWGSEAGRLRSASAAASAPRRARQAAGRSCERGTGSHGRGGARPGKRGPADAQTDRAALVGVRRPRRFRAERPGGPKARPGGGRPGGGGSGRFPATPTVAGLALEPSGRLPIHCVTGGQRPGGRRAGRVSSPVGF